MTVAELLEALPKSIKVGTVVYDVAIVPGLKSAEGEEINGYCEPQKLLISVDTDQPSKATAVDTVIHEILHGIWDERSLPKKPSEERAVRSLATGLIALFQDNPKLLTWIKKGLSKR